MAERALPKGWSRDLTGHRIRHETETQWSIRMTGVMQNEDEEAHDLYLDGKCVWGGTLDDCLVTAEGLIALKAKGYEPEGYSA